MSLDSDSQLWLYVRIPCTVLKATPGPWYSEAVIDLGWSGPWQSGDSDVHPTIGTVECWRHLDIFLLSGFQPWSHVGITWGSLNNSAIWAPFPKVLVIQGYCLGMEILWNSQVIVAQRQNWEWLVTNFFFFLDEESETQCKEMKWLIQNS